MKEWLSPHHTKYPTTARVWVNSACVWGMGAPAGWQPALWICASLEPQMNADIQVVYPRLSVFIRS